MKRLRQDLFVEYASLLRQAWLNPSYEPWQKLVHEFEHKHHDFLIPYFRNWNGKEP